MAFNANTFRQTMPFGGARPNLFEVTCTFPSFVSVASVAGVQMQYRCKAASVPTMTVEPIEVPYFDRMIKIPGDRTFEEWNATIINDEDYILRNAFEEWQNGISQIDFDTETSRSPESLGINNYVADVSIRQYSRAGTVVKQYLLKNAWPSNVAAIDLSWEERNAIEEFEVTFNYDYFVTEGIGSAANIGKGAFAIASDLIR